MPNYLLYSPDVETIKDDEQETFGKIIKMMTEGQDLTMKKYGRPLRISHAKAHAILKGKFIVNDGLPEELAQGFFAKPGTYDVLVRMASAPGEILDDSKVNPSRGIGVKIFGVEGPKIPGHTANDMDFVFETGPEFAFSDAAVFLQGFKPNAELAPKLSDTTKGVVSTIARATNTALHAVGADSAKLGFYGSALINPLGDIQYSQTPYRYGKYVAKMGIFPDTPGLEELMKRELDPKSPDAWRDACNEYLRNNDAEYSFRVQLNTGKDDMPIEDATAKWPEDLSPFREVARLVIPAQTAFDAAKNDFVEPLSFSPDHALEAHRPLGSINRARLAAYAALAATRRAESHSPTAEPENAAALPA